MNRRETVRDWLYTNLSTITTGNGYRTSPRVHKHFVYPTTDEATHLCLIFESEVWTAQDDNMTDFDSEVKVVVLGRFKTQMNYSGVEAVSGSESEGEALLEDMKKCVYSLMLSEVNNAGGRRLILGKKGVQCFGPTYYPGNTGECRLEFFVKLPSQDGGLD